MPHVVVGDVSHSGVANLRLAGQLCLGHGGHANDVHAPLPEDVALGLGAEARPLAGDECAPFVDGSPSRLHRFVEHTRQVSAEGLSEADMDH